MDENPNLEQALLKHGQTTMTEAWENENFYEIEPFEDGVYVTYTFNHEKKKFVMIDKEFPDLGVQKEDLNEFIEKELNKEEYLNFPSFWLRFLATFLFVVAILTVTIVLVMIWSMLILDLVFFSLAIFILKRSVMLFWVLRVAIINKGYFTNLRRKIKKLNKDKDYKKLLKFTENQGNLEFTLNPSEKLLKIKKVE